MRRAQAGSGAGQPAQGPFPGERESAVISGGGTAGDLRCCAGPAAARMARSGVEMAPAGVVQRLVCGRGLALSLGQYLLQEGQSTALQRYENDSTGLTLDVNELFVP